METHLTPLQTTHHALNVDFHQFTVFTFSPFPLELSGIFLHKPNTLLEKLTNFQRISFINLKIFRFT